MGIGLGAVAMFKKRRRRGDKGGTNVRKKEKVSEDADDDQPAVVKVTKETTKVNTFSTGSGAKSSTALTGLGLAIASTKSAKAVEYGGGATAQREVDTAVGLDAQSILEKNIALNEEGGGASDGTVYKGQAAYKNYIAKDAASVGKNKVSGTQGPIRAPTFVRSSCRFDYQPDVCKDYKDTGFCGFGDSCKFIHDRGNYKTGWELEQEWKRKEDRRKREMLGEELSDDEERMYEIKGEEETPFACHICREDFTAPVVTQCGHYFCMKCALDRYASSSRCAICDKQTSGVFNEAKDLAKKIKLKKAMEAKGGGGGGGEGDDDDDATDSGAGSDDEEGGGGGRGKAGAAAGSGGASKASVGTWKVVD